MTAPAPMATSMRRISRNVLDDEVALRGLITFTVREAIKYLLGDDHDPVSVQVMQLVEAAEVLVLADFAPPLTTYGVLASLPRPGKVVISRFAPVPGALAVDLVAKVRR